MSEWADVVALAGALPEVDESTSYGTPALKVRGRGFARLRTEAEGGLMVVCSLEEKEALLAEHDDVFFTIPHYDGYGAILVDLGKVDRGRLAELVEEAWRIKAPVRLRKEHDAS